MGTRLITASGIGKLTPGAPPNGAVATQLGCGQGTTQAQIGIQRIWRAPRFMNWPVGFLADPRTVIRIGTARIALLGFGSILVGTEGTNTARHQTGLGHGTWEQERYMKQEGHKSDRRRPIRPNVANQRGTPNSPDRQRPARAVMLRNSAVHPSHLTGGAQFGQ
jgi:hypothetical protein